MSALRTLVFSLALIAPCYAAVDGIVMSGTTGQPQANAIVSLVQPGQGGMKTLFSVKTDAQGVFRFDKDVPPGPILVQTFFDGVNYNQPLMPGTPTSGIRVQVYNATNKPVAKVAQHFIVLQPSATDITVSEGILYQGDPKLAYSDPVNGTLQFYLPPEAGGKVQVTINSTGGMPIQRPAEKTKQPNVYKVDYAIKPGETRFDLNYTLPATNPMTYTGKILHAEGASDLVAPQGVTLKGADVELAGTEPTTQASVYKIKSPNFTVQVEGTGALQAGAGGGGGGAASPEEDNGAPTLQEVKPRIYDRMYWILGMAFAVLGLGSVVLYRTHQA
ncbi:MAG TPA: carboxypeptidase-like regulatory domain-containing protein [Bryobacteraceae bacterium]|nr:carboxypeptidase-like regulatory domain-containing protein [Bryobacteraceae bacterium]